MSVLKMNVSQEERHWLSMQWMQSLSKRIRADGGHVYFGPLSIAGPQFVIDKFGDEFSRMADFASGSNDSLKEAAGHQNSIEAARLVLALAEREVACKAA